MKRTKRNILIEFVGGRYLSERKADTIREMAASFKPKLHLIKSNWPYCEVRGVNEQKAARLLDALGALPELRFKVNG